MIGKKLISHSIIYGAASLLINGSNFFLIPIYTHYLTTAEYGIISSVAVFSAITTSIFTLGFNGAVTRFYVEYSTEQFREFLFSVFVFQVVFAALVCLPFVLLNGLFLDSIFKGVPFEPYLRYGIYIGITGIFSTVPLAFLQAQSKALGYRIFTTVSFLILTALMFVMVVFNRSGSIGGVQATLYANCLMALIYTGFLLRQSIIRFHFPYVRAALTFGVPVMLYAVFGSLIELSSKYFIERFVSLDDLGIYNAGYQMASVILLVINAVNMAWVPVFFAKAKENISSTLFGDFGKLLIVCLTVGGLAVALLANEIIGLLDNGYAQAASIVPILVLTHVVGGGYWVLMVNPISYARKTVYLPILTTISGVFSVFLSLFLIPKAGMVGAALSTLLSYLLLIAISYVVFKRFSQIRYDFARMNTMILIAIVIYLVSLAIPAQDLIISIVIKLTLLVLYVAILQFARVYSIQDAIAFVKSTH
ncbi:MAG TPA: lipopolysaccharide biosynthesis protein [Chryseosolibacter sp.]